LLVEHPPVGVIGGRAFKEYEPSPDDEVAVARRSGMSWKRIGAELGISAQPLSSATALSRGPRSSPGRARL